MLPTILLTEKPMPNHTNNCPDCAATLQRAIHAETLLAQYKKIIWSYLNDNEAPPTSAEVANAVA